MNQDQQHAIDSLVVISLLNWMNYEDIIQCVESIEGFSDAYFEIVLCDNASPNNSYELLKARFPHLYIHQSKVNNALSALIKAHEQYPNSILSSVLLQPSNRELVAFGGALFIDELTQN